ncbi:hypothetical protein [Sorangium sp. So ce1151]|uniref:hypothetical protein n=1 Tax=Sorangium sp. So ce1151 TaxID=3133332 RepID=UPI003F62E76F
MLLGQLAEAMRAALAAGDVEAARVARETIGRLLGVNPLPLPLAELHDRRVAARRACIAGEDEHRRHGGGMKTVRLRHGISALFAVASFSFLLTGFTDMEGSAEDEREEVLESESAVNWETACHQRVSHASRQIERVRAAYQACAIDNDCVMLDTSTACNGDCDVVINQTGVPKMRRVISHLNATVCAEHRRMGCSYSAPRCVTYRAACAGGECTSAPL